MKLSLPNLFLCLFLLIVARTHTGCTNNEFHEVSGKVLSFREGPNNKAIGPDTTSETIVSGAVKILFTGTFHEGEVWEEAEQEHWLGVFSQEQGYYLKPVRIILNKVEDPLLDEQGETTGWEVSIKDNNSAEFLVTGLPLKERELEPVPLGAATIYPGDTSVFEFNGITYKLWATGNKELASPEQDWYVISDYKLYLTGTKNARLTTQLLVSHETFDDAMTSILWAGDLDGDEIPDLLIDLSDHYNVSIPTLFLSGGAEDDMLLQPVAEHTSVGC